jgi:hypothetical protein
MSPTPPGSFFCAIAAARYPGVVPYEGTVNWALPIAPLSEPVPLTVAVPAFAPPGTLVDSVRWPVLSAVAVPSFCGVLYPAPCQVNGTLSPAL